MSIFDHLQRSKSRQLNDKYILDVLKAKCGNCVTEQVFSIRIERKWLARYYIPILPNTRYFYLICNDCQCQTEISKNVVKRLKKFKQCTTLLLEHKISDEEYHAALIQHGVFPDEFIPNNDWECPKCKRANSGITYRCKCGYGV